MKTCHKTSLLVVTILLLITPTVWSQLVVNVVKPKFVGAKADIKLEFENKFSKKIESARAILFLVDQNGKVVGQRSQWVIGGSQERPGLAAGETNSFHFVISTQNLTTTTNISTKLTFNRIVFEDGKPADVNKSVVIHQATR